MQFRNSRILFPALSRTVLLRLVVVSFLLACALLGPGIRRLPITYLLGAMGAAGLALVALQRMPLGLTLLVLTAGTVPFSIGTGTLSRINLAMMLAGLLTGAWLIRMVHTKRVRLVPSPLNFPLLAFLVAAALSWIASALALGTRVALPGNILIVQAGQFGIYALSVAAFLLAANHPLGERTLKIWTAFLIVGGCMIVLYQLGIGWRKTMANWSGALYMWPFVLLLAQILFNPELDRRLKVLGLGLMGMWAYWMVTMTMTWKGGWVPAFLAFSMLLLLRSWRLFLVVLLILALLFLAVGPEQVLGTLLRSEEASANPVRWHLWLDVFRMGTRSFLFGLGPATYEYYWQNLDFEALSFRYVNPDAFRRAVYSPPAHNMFADIFAQTGILGTFFLVWALVAGLRLGFRVRKQRLSGFGLAYANGVLCGFAALIASSFFLAEWLIPYVYNLGLGGFPQAVYAWLLLGTLVPLATGKIGQEAGT